ncbi:MAG: hypothetical protein LBB67_06645 [Oscillospiraceae bacterium]|jgi:hypothetical protein|nr:hypothetical protein [Oscillospiraceae bacterium]
MLNNALYDEIFRRKSIRAYQSAPLTRETIALAQKCINSAVPLIPSEHAELQFVQSKDEGIRRVNSYCADSLIGRVNLGYMLEQIHLSLSLNGIASLWWGMAREPGDIAPPDGLRFAIALKVGLAQDTLHRSITEFDRVPIEEIVDDAPLQSVFEPLRLAPSAMNSQPWYATREKGQIKVFCAKPGVLKKIFVAKMNQLDIGIAVCHIVLALEHENIQINAVHPLEDTNAPKGYYPVLALETSL